MYICNNLYVLPLDEWPMIIVMSVSRNFTTAVNSCTFIYFTSKFIIAQFRIAVKPFYQSKAKCIIILVKCV